MSKIHETFMVGFLYLGEQKFGGKPICILEEEIISGTLHALQEFSN